MLDKQTDLFAEWINRYLTGDLGPFEAELLRKNLLEDESLQKVFVSNALCDFYLQELLDPDTMTSEKWDRAELESHLPSGLVVGTEKTKATDQVWEQNKNEVDVHPFFMAQDPELNTPIIRLDPIDFSKMPKNKTSFRINKKTGQRITNKGVLRRRSSLLFTGMTCFLLVLFLSVTLIRWGTTRPESVSENPSIIPTIRMADTINAVWQEGSTPFKRGQMIGTEKICLKSGLARLEYKNGTSIILQGPSEFVVNNPLSVRCERGRMSATIAPESIGFEVITPFGTVVDRGTEFFVGVTEDKLDVHVHKGKVDVASVTDSVVSLETGHGVTSSFSGKLKKIAALPFFMDLGMFESNLFKFRDTAQQEINRRWEKLDRDPRLLARFDFCEWQNGSVRNCSLSGSGSVKNVVLTNCSRTVGPLSDLKAVQISSKRARGWCDISGSFSSFTLRAFVRVDRLANQGNILMMSERCYTEPGAMTWQLSSDGRLQLFLDYQDKTGMKFHSFQSEPCFKISQARTWTEFVLVLDAKKKKILHYVDGRLVGTNDWNGPYEIKPGKVCLGNVTEKELGMTPKYLDGAFGGLCLYGDAIPSEELSLNNSPYYFP